MSVKLSSDWVIAKAYPKKWLFVLKKCTQLVVNGVTTIWNPKATCTNKVEWLNRVAPDSWEVKILSTWLNAIFYLTFQICIFKKLFLAATTPETDAGRRALLVILARLMAVSLLIDSGIVLCDLRQTSEWCCHSASLSTSYKNTQKHERTLLNCTI